MSDLDILEIFDDAIRANKLFLASSHPNRLCSFTNILKCKFIFLHSQQMDACRAKTWNIDSIVKRCKYSVSKSNELSNFSQADCLRIYTQQAHVSRDLFLIN